MEEAITHWRQGRRKMMSVKSNIVQVTENVGDEREEEEQACADWSHPLKMKMKKVKIKMV